MVSSLTVAAGGGGADGSGDGETTSTRLCTVPAGKGGDQHVARCELRGVADRSAVGGTGDAPPVGQRVDRVDEAHLSFEAAEVAGLGVEQRRHPAQRGGGSVELRTCPLDASQRCIPKSTTAVIEPFRAPIQRRIGPQPNGCARAPLQGTYALAIDPSETIIGFIP